MIDLLRATALLLLADADAVSQLQPIAVRDRCPTCRLVVQPAREALGKEHGFDRAPSGLVWRADGSVVLLQAGDKGLPHLIKAGQAGRDLGRVGSGPGEFKAALAGVAVGDSVFLFDRLTQRVSLIDPSGRFVRSFPAPLHTLSMLWIASRQQLVLNAHIPDRSRVGVPFHVFDAVGNQVKSFGPTEAVMGGNPWNAVWRRAAVLPSGDLLSTPVLGGGGRISVLGSDGAQQALYNLELAELREPPSSRSTTEVPPPPPSIESIRADSTGVVWVLALVADKNWKNGIGVTRVESERTWKVDWIEPGRYQDTRVIAIDLARRQILAIESIDEVCRGFSPKGELICDAENRDGTYRLDLRPVRLTGR